MIDLVNRDEVGIDRDEDENSKDSSEFSKMFENSLRKPKRKLSVGDQVRSEILVLGKEEIFVSTGAPGISTDGVVPRKELLNPDGTLSFKVGDWVDLYVTQIRDSEISLSLKPASKNLLSARQKSKGALTEHHQRGDLVHGKVKRIEPFGAFVEFRPGVEGLLHISEMSWSRVSHPSDLLSIGQEITLKILKTEFHEGKLRVSLSMKQVGPVPWQSLPDRVRKGQVVEGKVTRCMKFGAFVELVPGVEGLIPLSEMSYTKRVVRSDELIQEGQQVSVMIQEVDTDAKRIALSLRDAGSDPWILVPQKFPVGTIIYGKVERREPYGLFVQLEEGVVGLLPKSKAQENSNFVIEKVKLGDVIPVQISELHLNERKIALEVPQDPNRDDWKSYTGFTNSSGFGTLGDQLKAVLEKKKK